MPLKPPYPSHPPHQLPAVREMTLRDIYLLQIQEHLLLLCSSEEVCLQSVDTKLTKLSHQKVKLPNLSGSGGGVGLVEPKLVRDTRSQSNLPPPCPRKPYKKKRKSDVHCVIFNTGRLVCF